MCRTASQRAQAREGGAPQPINLRLMLASPPAEERKVSLLNLKPRQTDTLLPALPRSLNGAAPVRDRSDEQPKFGPRSCLSYNGLSHV